MTATLWQIFSVGFILALAYHSLTNFSGETTAILFALVWLGVIISENHTNP
jgi:hypothetical protein